MRGKLFMAAGAAAMYYLDPNQGRMRRARTRSRVASMRRQYERRSEADAFASGSTNGIAGPAEVPYSRVDSGR